MYNVVCIYVQYVCVYVLYAVLVNWLTQPNSATPLQVLAEQLGHVFRPIRDPSHRNYLSEASFPEEVLPALALGNFYVLSADLTRHIAQNISAAIIPVGTLEDLSVAVWMRQQQVCRCAYAYCVSVCMYVPKNF